MFRTRIHASWQHGRLGRHAMACLLVLALMWAQSLGLWHGVVHGDASHSPRIGLAQLAGQEPAQAHNALQRLFAGHLLDSDCQFFDQHSHGDILSGLAPTTAVLALPAAVLVARHALAVSRWHALFQARGPPSVR